MAGGYGCEFCEGANPVTVLVTWLTNGASVSLCAEDFAPAMINILAVDLGVDPSKLYEHVKRFVDKQARLAEAEAEKGTPDTDPSGAEPGTGELTPEHPNGIEPDDDGWIKSAAAHGLGGEEV